MPDYCQPHLRGLLTQFARDGTIPEDSLPPHILQGWELSRAQGIDPWNPRVPHLASSEELEKLYTDNRQFLDAATPMLKMLEVSIRDTGCIATLAITSGYLLSVVGDDALMDEAEKAFNIPGALRSVESVGASALTMCILLRRPVQVAGFHHYNCLFHDWRCTAAPIFDAMAQPIGSLTISGPISRDSRHTLALAKSCAQIITIRLRENQLLKSQQRLNAMLQSVYDALPEAILAIDPEGRVSHANYNATKLMDQGPLEGQPISTFIHPKSMPTLRAILRSNKPASAEMTLLADGEPIARSCRFVPIVLHGGATAGMIMTITAMKQLINIATQVGGNYAKYSFQDIKGHDPVLREQIDLARLAATTTSRILLSGESGTGKELFAQAIHNSSQSQSGPFVAISCASIPRDLIESELFGYVGGTFTGAREKGMIGKFELACGGTLFLDEVNSLPLDMQAKLLRALQQREIMRIGDTRPTPINAKIISATNVNLQEAIALGNFRSDLYYRLNVVEICIPPLRQRKGDIAYLAELILRRLSAETQIPLPSLSPEVLDALLRYNWPGNVRELDNVCERALLLCGSGQMTLEHLPRHLQEAVSASGPLSHLATGTGGTQGSLDQMYQQTMLQVLERYEGNVSKAAAHLGIARSTLYRRLRKFGIDPDVDISFP